MLETLTSRVRKSRIPDLRKSQLIQRQLGVLRWLAAGYRVAEVTSANQRWDGYRYCGRCNEFFHPDEYLNHECRKNL